jgi:hypothetical protein
MPKIIKTRNNTDTAAPTPINIFFLPFPGGLKSAEEKNSYGM